MSGFCLKMHLDLLVIKKTVIYQEDK